MWCTVIVLVYGFGDKDNNNDGEFLPARCYV